MELVSYLAGARWSDHPACTHPLLASLARLVNDHTSDAGRGELTGLVPSVIGLTSDNPHVNVRIALRAATAARPIAAADRQRVLAVSVLSAERVLDVLDGRPAGSLEERSRWALAQVPHARSGPAASRARSGAVRRASTGMPRPTPSATPWWQSRKRTYRTGTGFFVICSQARSETVRS